MEILFPFKGINKGVLTSKQPIDTARNMSNVRPYADGRLRGGQRPGFCKASTVELPGPIVEIMTVTVVN